MNITSHDSNNNTIYFFFNDTATTEIYTLSLHDALPISIRAALRARNSSIRAKSARSSWPNERALLARIEDRKSTRLNSSHVAISYAVFCLKKKNKMKKQCTL